MPTKLYGAHKFLRSKTLDAVKRFAKVPLGTGAAAGGVFAWANPENRDVLVNRVTVDLTTRAGQAGTVSVGTAANGTTLSNNLIDTLDVRTASGVFDNLQNPGAAGKPLQRLAQGAYVTASQASGSVAGMAGNAYIEYMIL